MKKLMLAFWLSFVLGTPIHLGAQTATADKPLWQTGAFWQYQGSSNGRQTYMTHRFEGTEEIEGRQYYVVRTGSQRTYFTDELHLAFIRNARGETINVSEPPMARFKWPLKVGESWTQHVTHTISGRTYTYHQDFKVLAYEKIRVAAGEFEAFKISRAVVNGVTYEEYWYAPLVGNIIKMVSTSGTGGEVEYELVSYR